MAKVRPIPKCPQDSEREECAPIGSDYVGEDLLNDAHTVRRDEARHEGYRLIEQIRKRKIRDNSRQKDQCWKERHHEIIGQRSRHLKRMGSINIRIRSRQSRFEIVQGHVQLDAPFREWSTPWEGGQAS